MNHGQKMAVAGMLVSATGLLLSIGAIVLALTCR